MTTASNIENLPETIPTETLPARRGGMFARHWRGDYSLPRSYWVNGALIFGLGINMLFLIMVSVAMAVLQKPFTPQDLLGAVEGTLDGG